MAGTVTLVRLGLGFLAVAALFIGLGWVTGPRERRNAVALAAEALVLTLLAGLWFASLGNGGWVPVFLLIGLLASGPAGGPAPQGGGGGPAVRYRATALSALRYVAAGGLLALILG
jgi:hypothetical protein